MHLHSAADTLLRLFVLSTAFICCVDLVPDKDGLEDEYAVDEEQFGYVEDVKGAVHDCVGEEHQLHEDESGAGNLYRVQHAVAHGARRRSTRHVLSQVVRCVELVEAPPAELILALGALHELATTGSDNADPAGRAHLGAQHFVQVAK